MALAPTLYPYVVILATTTGEPDPYYFSQRTTADRFAASLGLQETAVQRTAGDPTRPHPTQSFTTR